jgi:DNA-binding PadR family transcriptional regulator
MLTDRPMYAYEINKTLNERFNFSTATITVYVVLYKMENEGLIRVEKDVPNLGKPSRKYYCTTSEGVKTLEKGRAFLKETIERIS